VTQPQVPDQELYPMSINPHQHNKLFLDHLDELLGIWQGYRKEGNEDTRITARVAKVS